MNSIDNFSKEEAVKWLRDAGLSVSGSKDELICRIKKYLRYPQLVDKYQAVTQNNFKFSCSLDPQIPQINHLR